MLQYSVRSILLSVLGLIVGLAAGYYVVTYTDLIPSDGRILSPVTDLLPHKPVVIGFLPYWLAGKAKSDYSPYITELSYFSLTVDADGSIRKLANEQEEDPGWHALKSDTMTLTLESALKKGLSLSVVLFSAEEETISQLISDPETHGRKLISDLAPLMKEHTFSDLNLDIESVKEASPEAQALFTRFVKTLRDELHDSGVKATLTVDVSPTALIKPYLINVEAIEPHIDRLMLMTYDYHYQGSSVTGPVAPLSGAGTESEFDTEVGVRQALRILPARRVLMGLPLYGYEWETIGDSPRSGVIPGTGITASNQRVESLLATCATCSAQLDGNGKESYVIFKDSDTGTYHQIYFPDAAAMKAKLDFAKQERLGGVAMWALGYEGSTILDPLSQYLR